MQAAGRRVDVAHAEARPGEVRHSSLDASRLRGLGWEGRVGIVDGLRETYEWIHAAAEAAATT
jgi:nucleoside-diphosphate-sugar epimerase